MLLDICLVMIASLAVGMFHPLWPVKQVGAAIIKPQLYQRQLPTEDYGPRDRKT